MFTRSDGTELEILHPPYCEICGNPIPDSFALSHPYCGACKDCSDKLHPIVQVRAFGKYYYEDEKPDDVLSNEIRRFKRDKRLAPLLLECMYYAIDVQYPDLQELDVVIPVMRGTQDGGYNQSGLLAQGIAAHYGKPFVDVLYKQQPYRSMHDIHDHREKEAEIAGKIGCNYVFESDESVLLIDDTCIDMVTKRECARVLKANGASTIKSLVIGRMVNRRHMETLRRYND
nr:ComF family protein [Methanoregula formicica]